MAPDPDLLAWTPWHRDHWPKSVARPAEYRGGERLSITYDLGALPEKEKRAAIRDWCAELPGFRDLRWLSLWSHVTQPVFDAACQLRDLECLEIKWSSVVDLGAIRNLLNLRYLFIGSSTKIRSIEPLTSLTKLRLLEIENFKLVNDFTPLTTLTSLESLAVTGSMWSRQDVGALDPFTKMTWLRSLAIDTPRVGSIQPLATLRNLEALGLGGRLPMEEYARLAAKLPAARCRWFAPYLEMEGTGIGHCERCQRDSKVMLTGKGAPVLCKHCDATRVQRHVAAFEAAKNSEAA